jgi:hypothetical protein
VLKIWVPAKKDPSRHARGLRVGGAGCQPLGGPC